jgi:acetaldehyde dehydrogenase/alcohol dehydrogenase
MSAPKGLTAASGIDAAVHSLEAWASMLATSYTDSLALGALSTIFKYLPRAWAHGAEDPEAREKMADAATMAGMAFANAFLGVCHSMAHKLGAFFHVPHGVANALLITQVMRFNASETPTRMGTFPQYGYPKALARYAELADRLGVEGLSHGPGAGQGEVGKLEALIAKIDQLKRDIGLPVSISAFGIQEEAFMAKIDAMSLAAFDDQCTGANPRYPLVAEIREMFVKAFYGEGFGRLLNGDKGGR